MMENKFTPRAEESLRLAQEAAEEMGHGYVGSEHLLLGLMREEEGIAHRVLEEAGLTDDMICDVLHRSVGTGLSGAAPSQGLTPRAKSAVELAVSEASRTGAGYIGTEHLLMGLLREGNNMAIRVLRTVGIDPKKLYSAVVKKINEAPRAAAAAGSGSAAPAREDGKKGGTLAEFTRDLTEAARSGKLDPVIGREKEMTASVQWMERTLDDSANRRLSMPEGFLCADAILRLAQNVTDGLRVNEKVVDKTIREYMPFLATENLMMEAVKRGGDRQELHERVRVHSMAATARMKDGEPCDLLDRLASDPAFGMTRPELDRLMDPARYIGRCPQQVRALLDRIAPLLEGASSADGGVSL